VLKSVCYRIAKGILAVLLISLLPSVLIAEEPLSLDCNVTNVNPVIELTDSPQIAAVVRMEHYRFVITSGQSKGLATTTRTPNLPATVVESEDQFQIYFENRVVVIDRFTTGFKVWLQGAKIHLGSGSCTILDRRRF